MKKQKTPGHSRQPSRGGARRLAVLAMSLALAVGGLGTAAGGASADTAPANPNDPRTPVTVSADALPTAQHNGVAWQSTIIGNTVYVVGKFSQARPAGAAPGTQNVPRSNILAFDLTTGALTSFAPKLNGQALAVTASPDGRRLYVGGDFTTVNGQPRSRLAALDPATGALIDSFAPKVGGSVRSIVATGSFVYIGGNFTTVGSTARSRLAAVAANGGALLSWAPKANGRVNAMALSPDGQQMVIGGAFTTMNGSGNPGFGLARVNALSGINMSLGVNSVVRNGGDTAAILSLHSDGTNFYGTGYHYKGGGNLEGAFSGNWSDGNLKWVQDCRGDSYGVWASATAVYVASHSHSCVNLPGGGFPETKPQTWYRATAFSKAATGVLAPTAWALLRGKPAPSQLAWYPALNTGTATGQYQGPWAVTGNSNYVVMVGEFTTANGTPQQGMVRFAGKGLAPNKQGPQVSGAAANPTAKYVSAGKVTVGWQANHDRDNEVLTYQVVRDGNVVHTVQAVSRFYSRPTLSFTDSGLTKGQHTYQIVAKDGFGNTVRSGTVAVSVTAGG